MGCLQAKKEIKTIKSSFLYKPKDCKSKERRLEAKFQNRILESSWVNVIGFLSYREVKECGKINRFFLSVCKQEEILTKFINSKNNIKTSAYKLDSTKCRCNSSIFTFKRDDCSLYEGSLYNEDL